MGDLEIMFKKLMGEFQGLKQQFEATQKDNEFLKVKIEQMDSKLPDLASTLDEMERRNTLAEANPEPTNIQEFGGYKEGSIRKNKPEKLPFIGKKDCCPYCTEHGDSSLLDLTKSGRWACRKCGKHWYGEALGQKYSKELERYIREEGTEDPVKAFRREKDAEDKENEIDALKRELTELKNMLIQGGLGKK